MTSVSATIHIGRSQAKLRIGADRRGHGPDEAGVSRSAMLGAGAFEAGRGDRMRFSAFDVLYIEGWTLGAAVAAAGLRGLNETPINNREGAITRRAVIPVRFVPLTGEGQGRDIRR